MLDSTEDQGGQVLNRVESTGIFKSYYRRLHTWVPP